MFVFLGRSTAVFMSVRCLRGFRTLRGTRSLTMSGEYCVAKQSAAAAANRVDSSVSVASANINSQPHAVDLRLHACCIRL